MPILKIARMGHPVLMRRAAEVDDPASREVRELVAAMVETMSDAEGVGLAAPQVHVPWRVVIFTVPLDRVGEGAAQTEPQQARSSGAAMRELTILVNPVIEPLTEAREEGWEGCLSVPGLRGRVPRTTQIRYRGFTLDGEPLEREAEGLHARVVQHECDHLDGILYPMRMTDLSKLVFTSQLHHHLEAERGSVAQPGTARPVFEQGAEPAMGEP